MLFFMGLIMMFIESMKLSNRMPKMSDYAHLPCSVFVTFIACDHQFFFL